MPLKIIHKQTLTYHEAEDRLQLVSQGEANEVLVLWLTRRLADRLVPALFQRLESPGNSAVLAWEQQLARAAFEPSEPVTVSGDTRQCLVQSIDIVPLSEGIELVFRASSCEARFAMGGAVLRQWLGILHGWYLHAGWDTAPIWPAWFESAEQSPEIQAPAGAVFH